MKYYLAAILALLLGGAADCAFAGFGDELNIFRYDDAAPGDEFGNSVHLYGNLAIYGAPGRQENGVDSGAAYVIDVTTGQQVVKLVPDDLRPEDRFGTSVSIEDNIAIVGSLHANERGRFSGAAYLFDINTGQQLHKLIGNDTVAGDEFGVSVDIEDGVAIVGAHMHGTGMAYLFDVNTGSQIRSLISEDAAPEDLFGVAVALDGNTALVGARYDDDLGIASGSAYLFDVTTGQQLHKLNALDGYWGDRFGMYLDVDGNTAIVASRYDDDQIKSSGSAYLFNVDDGKQRFKLVASDSDPNDHFGSAVSVSGDLAIVGAVNDESLGLFSGSAYVYNVNTGEELMKLNASDGAFFDQFGHAVAMDGDLAVVGATQLLILDGNEALPSGKGYTFNLVPEPAATPLLLIGLLSVFFRARQVRSGR